MIPTSASAPKMLDAPRSRQFRTNDCGINDAGVALAYYGINEREMQLIDLAGLPEDGLETVDLVNLLKRFENRGITLDAGTMTLDNIRGAIDDGYPVILAIQAYADDPTRFTPTTGKTAITSWQSATTKSGSSSKTRPVGSEPS